ncbi:AAEL005295-PA [Aedes aegypti]|uniref:AAEL005295-PA n=1 Tax=Aedes aegypti TaxID=7159 RepID=Q17AG7_AEDAE|nr:AAEL005295-PA [Aedes aegypti]
MYAVTVRMANTSHKKKHPKCKLIPLSNSGGAVLDHEKKRIRNHLDVQYSPLNKSDL